MVNQIWAKNCDNISHIEVPTELVSPNSSTKRNRDDKDSNEKSRPNDHTPLTKKRLASDRIVQPYSAELKAMLQQPIKDAGDPPLFKILEYCGLSTDQLLPDLDKTDCRQFLVMGSCMYGKSCRFNHRTATKQQITSLKEKLKRLIDEPLGLKGENSTRTSRPRP